ncbi:nitroreductase family protein [Candidatus Mcinerneyibacteriota bacterium]|nr:nitroreductase family protein [Candidatus Mcinerneyibacteriota bacterium]
MRNETVNLMLNRKSIRSFTERQPSEVEVEVLLEAARQAPFAYQAYSILLRRDRSKNPFHAPLTFIFCADLYKIERMMEIRGWKRSMNDIFTLLLAFQDAAYAAQNMVIAAESLKMGSCYIGGAPLAAPSLRKEFDLPPLVFPLVGLAVGYPGENPPVRPRFPRSFTVIEGKYPRWSEEEVSAAMEVMDQGYLDQDYYRQAGFMIPLKEGMEEKYSFDNYSWTEHISRKLGLWESSPERIEKLFRENGFLGDEKDQKTESPL